MGRVILNPKIKEKNYIGFMDETGILKDENQRFFALGLLKLNDTSVLYSKLWKIRNKAISSLHRQGKSPKLFEFKFNKINYSILKYYRELLETYFNFAELNFCCFIIDKQDSQIDMGLYDAWDFYIRYSITVIKHNLKDDENMFIIADYLGKPKSSSEYWEYSVKSIPNVYNAIMIESHASLFIQLVDVLIGCVAYDYKINRQKHKPNEPKLDICNFVKVKLGRKDLIGGFTVNHPNCFNVWEFKPTK